MAYTEFYVSVLGGGNSSGDSEANAWTFAEFIADSTNRVAGDRVNIISGSYSSGAVTLLGSGDNTQMYCVRGYNTAIGDLEGQGFNSDGTLNVTNYPVITMSGLLTLQDASSIQLLLQNLSFTGAISSALIGTSSPDNVYLIECKLLNTQDNIAARCLQADNQVALINCDFECSGAAHNNVVDTDNTTLVSGCRFKGTETNQVILWMNFGTVINSLFVGPGVGLAWQSHVSFFNVTHGNTFYLCDTAITYPNSAASVNGLIHINNHITDCGVYVNNLYSGTAVKALLEVNNRTRANTTPRTGIGDGANVGEITTDTGGASTDYANAGSNDFHLIDAAPGQGAGQRALDIGAYKAEDPAGGGGGLLIHPGMTGGIRG